MGAQGRASGQAGSVAGQVHVAEQGKPEAVGLGKYPPAGQGPREAGRGGPLAFVFNKFEGEAGGGRRCPRCRLS